MHKLYPYQTLKGQPSLSISEVIVDGVPLLDENRRDGRLEVYRQWESAYSWREAQIQVLVEMDRRNDLSPSLACLSVRSEKSLNRTSHYLEPDHDSAMFKWRGRVSLSSCNLSGDVRFKALLVDAESRYLGESDEWKLQIEEPEIPDINGILPVSWTDFQQSDDPITKAHEGQPYAVNLLSDPPQLLLNMSCQEIVVLLDNEYPKGSVGAGARSLEILSIARSTWMGLLTVAASSIHDAGESGEFDYPLEDWKRKVLDAILPTMYPHVAGSEALRLASESVTDPDGIADFLKRGLLAVDERLGAVSKLRVAAGSLEGAS